eukprot:221125-Pelagomonas_calceolata.AAC.4
MLECKVCKANLSPVKPAETRKHHSCIKAESAAAAALQSEGERSSSRKQAREQEQEVEEVDCVGQPKKPRTMTAFSVSTSQLKQFLRPFASISPRRRRPSRRVAAAQP